MSQLYTRHGTPQSPNATKGVTNRPAWTHVSSCSRCGGAGGSDKWAHTGWTCFQCGGSGKGPTIIEPLYTIEKLEQLNASQNKRWAKKQAEHKAAAEAKEMQARNAFAPFLAQYQPTIDALRFALPLCRDGSWPSKAINKALSFLDRGAEPFYLDEALGYAVEAAAKLDEKPSEWIGTVGERTTVTFTVTFVISFEPFRYGWPRSYLTVGKTDAGDVVVHKGANGWDKGETVTAKWTVKEHGEREGVKQTVLARPTFPKA